jgi:HlyD family secretion protein
MERVESGPLEARATGSGNLEGVSRVEISASAMGLIDTIAVDEGDSVTVGDLLLRLEQDQAQAMLDEASAGSLSAWVSWEQADRNRDRVTELWEAGLASEEEYRAAREAAQSAWAGVLLAEAAEDMAADAHSRTVYTSPLSGVVTSVNIEEGEMAVVGTMNNPGTVLMTVEDLSSLLVRVTMVESEVVNVEEGLIADVDLDALPDTTFSGEVVSVGLAAIPGYQGGSGVPEYEVLIELAGSDPRLRSGMSASVEIVTDSREQCLYAPVQCVVPRPDPADSSRDVEVVLRIESDSISEVPVTVGIMGMMDVEITGVSEGDTLVAGPLDALRELEGGDRVVVEDD